MEEVVEEVAVVWLELPGVVLVPVPVSVSVLVPVSVPG